MNENKNDSDQLMPIDDISTSFTRTSQQNNIIDDGKRKKSRNQSIDLLRVFATFFVIIYHIVSYGGKPSILNPYLTEIKISYSISTNCNFLFMLITGYTTCKNDFNVMRLAELIIQNSFVPAILYYFSIYIGINEFMLIKLFHRFFPMMFNVYWYTPSYIFSRLIFAFIWKGMNYYTKSFYLFVTIILFALYALSFAGFFHPLRLNVLCSQQSFIVPLFIGSCIKRYEFRLKNSVAFVLLLVAGITHYKFQFGHIELNNVITYNMFHKVLWNHPLTLVYSVTIFLSFLNLKIPNKIGKVAEKLSRLSFGIYLCHMNYDILPLWKDPVNEAAQRNSPDCFFVMMKTTMKVYFFCAIIEFVRAKMFSLLIFNRKWYIKLSKNINDCIIAKETENENNYRYFLE